MLKNIAALLIISSSIVLTGCASNASSEQMTYQVSPSAKPQNTRLADNIDVSQVTGGHETNPLLASNINDENFQIALKESLKKASLYNKINDGKYQLNAHLVKVDRPLFGINLKVICQVHYTLKDNKLSKTIYDKDVTSEYTATIHDSAIALTRLKMANEGAARNNIKQLIEDLYKLS
ncbi:MAG: hypothetical protein WAW86_02595 [Gammaproteobacteria bacterium]